MFQLYRRAQSAADGEMRLGDQRELDQDEEIRRNSQWYVAVVEGNEAGYRGRLVLDPRHNFQ